MNILPKKRWHVRTRENIARVRKDEQEAAEEAARKKQRIELADREARAALLRQRAKAQFGIKDDKEDVKQEPCYSAYGGNKHINFFEELEEGKVVTTKTNEETVREEKAKREAYEKRIGYLTYLGQDTVELTGKTPWYDKIPDRLKFKEAQFCEETNMNSKLVQDPLTLIKRFIPSKYNDEGKEKIESSAETSNEHHSELQKKEKKHKKKSKKHKKKSGSHCSGSDHDDKKFKKRKREISSGGSSPESELEEKGVRKSIEQLREERLKREKQEKKRVEELLAQLQKGRTVENNRVSCQPVLQKYNSQFNPDIANQNFRREPWDR